MKNKLFIVIVVLGFSVMSVFAQRAYKFHPEAERPEFSCFKSATTSTYKDVLKDLVYENNRDAIRFLFLCHCNAVSDFVHAELHNIASYSMHEKIEYLVERGVLEPIDGKKDMSGETKYYTTKKTDMHIWCDFFDHSIYIVSGPQFAAPIYATNTVILDELVELEERFLTAEEKLALLLERGILKKLPAKADLKKLNETTVVRRSENKAYVDSMKKRLVERAKKNGERFEAWYEGVRDSLEARIRRMDGEM